MLETLSFLIFSVGFILIFCGILSFYLMKKEKKISLKEIHKHIASFGHDTKLEKAPDQAYNSLEMCCKYRDEEVVKNHQ